MALLTVSSRPTGLSRAGVRSRAPLRVSAAVQTHKTPSLAAAASAAAAAALLLCTTSPVNAAPLSNPAFDIANPPISKNSDVMGQEPNPTAEGKNTSAPNTAQGAPPAAERPAAYEEALRTGAGQTNSPCPTGKMPCY